MKFKSYKFKLIGVTKVDYFESAEGVEISYKRACKEVLDHGCSVEEFVEDCGKHESYQAQAVLLYLGY